MGGLKRGRKSGTTLAGSGPCARKSDAESPMMSADHPLKACLSGRVGGFGAPVTRRPEVCATLASTGGMGRRRNTTAASRFAPGLVGISCIGWRQGLRTQAQEAQTRPFHRRTLFSGWRGHMRHRLAFTEGWVHGGWREEGCVG